MLNALKCTIWTQEIRLLFHNKEEEKNGNITRWDKFSDKKIMWIKLYKCTPLDYLENSLSSRVKSSATFKCLCGLPILVTWPKEKEITSN